MTLLEFCRHFGQDPLPDNDTHDLHKVYHDMEYLSDPDAARVGCGYLPWARAVMNDVSLFGIPHPTGAQGWREDCCQRAVKIVRPYARRLNIPIG